MGHPRPVHAVRRRVLFDLAVPPDSAAPSERARDPAGQDGDSTREPEDLYTEALAALYTERWDEAIQVFRVLTAGRGYKDSARKLEQARRGQRLAPCSPPGAAPRALALGGGHRAPGGVVAAEPGYQDAQQLLSGHAANRPSQRCGPRAESS